MEASGDFSASWGRLGASRGLLKGVLGASWGPSGGDLEASAAHRRRKVEKAKPIDFQQVFEGFGFLGNVLESLLGLSGAPLGSLLGALLGLRGSLGEPWRPRGGSVEASWRPLGISWQLLGVVLGRLGASRFVLKGVLGPPGGPIGDDL